MSTVKPANIFVIDFTLNTANVAVFPVQNPVIVPKLRLVFEVSENDPNLITVSPVSCPYAGGQIGYNPDVNYSLNHGAAAIASVSGGTALLVGDNFTEISKKVATAVWPLYETIVIPIILKDAAAFTYGKGNLYLNGWPGTDPDSRPVSMIYDIAPGAAAPYIVTGAGVSYYRNKKYTTNTVLA